MALERDILDTMIAEAGGNLAGLQAVAAVIQNRANKTGLTPAQVVRQQGQFQGYSNPGSASVKAQSDPQVRALAEKAYSDIASGTVPDPTNGGTSFRAATAAKGMSAPHGTVDIGGNRFAKGNSSPQTALSAINAVAPIPQPRPTSALGYEASAAAPKVPGLITPGNIDLNNRPVYFGNDGSYGTERSFSIGTDGGELLLPQIVNGKLVTQAEAIKHYEQTGENMGLFSTPAAADAYAEKTHLRDQGLGNLPVPMPSRPSSLSAPSSAPSVRAISVNPNGSPILPQMKLPQDAMYGINRLDPNRVTHAPNDFTTQDVGVPDARLSQLSAPFPQPANAFAGSRANGGASSSGLVSHPVQTLRIDPLTNQVISGNQPQSLQDALNVYAQRQALNTNGGSVKTTTAQAGNVALPKGVVPRQAAADLAAITQPSPFAGAVGSIGAQSPQVASTGFAPFTPNGMKPTLPSSTVNAASPLDNRYLGLASTPPVPPGVSAITAATNPFGGAVASGALKIKPPTVPIPVIPSSIGGKQPLTKYLPASQRQNDNLTTAGNVAGNILSATPAGHVWSLLTGAPNTGGGLLNGLFGYGGLLNSGPRMVSAPVVQQPLSPLLAQQSADQRGQAALQASGMVDSFGMITGSGGHSMWGSH